MLTRAWLGSTIALLLIAFTAQGAVKQGDRPTIDWKTIDDKPITNAELAGRLVVVDFWATWCGPCMHELPHMLNLYRQTQPLGVAFVGVSLDRDRGDLLKVVRSSKIPWPQVNDRSFSREWGVDSIPRVFILSPEGEVLWTGHPASIDDHLRDALRDHPPTVKKEESQEDPKLREEALAALKQATEALDAGDFTKVLKAAAQVKPESVGDRQVLAAVGILIRKVQVQTKDAAPWQEAIAADPASAAALQKLGQALLAPPPNPSGVAAGSAKGKPAPNPRLVEAKLAMAKKADEAKDYYAAWKCYDWLVRLAPDSDEGKAAASRLAEYDADEAIRQTLHIAHVEADARAALSMAHNYEQAGNLDLAKEHYQKVLDQYPEAKQACKEAKEALAKLDK